MPFQPTQSLLKKYYRTSWYKVLLRANLTNTGKWFMSEWQVTHKWVSCKCYLRVDLALRDTVQVVLAMNRLVTHAPSIINLALLLRIFLVVFTWPLLSSMPYLDVDLPTGHLTILCWVHFVWRQQWCVISLLVNVSAAKGTKYWKSVMVKFFSQLSYNVKNFLAKFIVQETIITANNCDTIGNKCSS